MSGQESRALLLKGDKAIQSASGGFSFFGGKTDKYETASEAYTSAANAFRMSKQNREAGQAFEKAAKVQIELLKVKSRMQAREMQVD